MEGLGQLHQLLQKYWVVLVLVSLLARLLYNKYGRKLNSIPGPFLAGFTDIWRFWNTCFANAHDIHIWLHRKTNSHFVRLGPRTISVSDTTLIPTIYGTNSGFVKSDYFVPAMMPFQGSFTPGLFAALDEDYHARLKKPINNAYSMSTMVEFEPLVDATTALLMSKLDDFAASGTSLDFGVWLQMYAFDVLGEVQFSQKLGFLESGKDVAGIMTDIRGKISYAGCVCTYASATSGPMALLTIAGCQGGTNSIPGQGFEQEFAFPKIGTNTSYCELHIGQDAGTSGSLGTRRCTKARLPDKGHRSTSKVS
ncbi:hypothetical protein LTR13_009595 [Exophiala sideris]|nr:hypothetical protein LTR13_009595 [Exophiala sideris]KAK5177740.1 hypothetical protein LTR44_009715 [Eurotiomycetes sp. CCFEE 6388]